LKTDSPITLDIVSILPNGGVHADLYIQGNVVDRLFLNKEEKNILEQKFGIGEKFLTELDDHIYSIIR